MAFYLLLSVHYIQQCACHSAGYGIIRVPGRDVKESVYVRHGSSSPFLVIALVDPLLTVENRSQKVYNSIPISLMDKFMMSHTNCISPGLIIFLKEPKWNGI
jgi:hypothetical protein